jgi:hypothetical protein
MNREPAFLIGLAASIIVAVVGQLVGHEILTAEGGLQVENLVAALVPVLTGLVTRTRVSPA